MELEQSLLVAHRDRTFVAEVDDQAHAAVVDAILDSGVGGVDAFGAPGLLGSVVAFDPGAGAVGVVGDDHDKLFW